MTIAKEYPHSRWVIGRSLIRTFQARTQKILNLPNCLYIKESSDFLQSYKNYAQFHYALLQKENISSPLTFFCLFFDGVSYDLWYFCSIINI